MYKTPSDTQAFFDAFPAARGWHNRARCSDLPPYIDLAVALAATAGSNVGIGAQNLATGKEGAMTGEISGHMLHAIGVSYVIIGHSERRQYFGENEAGVISKTQAALEYGLTRSSVLASCWPSVNRAAPKRSSMPVPGWHRSADAGAVREDRDRV